MALDGAEILSKIMVDGMPDRARFFEIVGGTIAGIRALLRGTVPEIAAFGEMVSLLWTEGRGRHSAGVTLERTGLPPSWRMRSPF